MLDRETRIRWTHEIVAYLNGETNGAWLGVERGLAASILRERPGWQRAAPPEKLRAELEGELRWFAEQLHTKRQQATRERWTPDERAKIQIASDVLQTHGDFWLGLGTSKQEIIPTFTYDGHGRVVMSPGGALPAEAVVALTIAELYASDSPVEVKACQDEQCGRLFVHEQLGARRPKEYCCEQHSARQRKLNFKRQHTSKRSKRK